MPRKDPRFNPKYAKALQKRKDDNKIEGQEIGNSTILEPHLASGCVTSSKLSTISIPQPFHCAYHLSDSKNGWTRIAQLNVMSAVEFWLRVTVSGRHNMAKIVGTYTFSAGGSPSATFAMICNSRYGTPGFNNVRLVYPTSTVANPPPGSTSSTYTYYPVYFEIETTTTATVSVGQISAFGATVSEFSNIRMENGSVPTGYSADTQDWGTYDSAIIMV